jgi:type III pantothenate kinase
MLLLVDAGNTRIKWALAAHDAMPTPGVLPDWHAHGAVTHAQLRQLQQAWLAAAGGGQVQAALICNVAGAAVRAELDACVQATFPAAAVDWFASTPERAGLRNGYRNPAQLGPDRFAAAIGARALVPDQAIIVATCGTATTIDAVSADGLFLGGMILPGLALMASSLARGTAQLPQIAAGHALPPGFADNTADAILSGCLAAQAGAIARAVALHGATQCILSGGAATAIAPALVNPHRLADNIVLAGLFHAAGDVARPSIPAGGQE